MEEILRKKMANIRSVVYLQPLALEELIRAVIETYNRECMGYAFGETKVKRKNNLYVVEAVHPMQMAIRKPSEIEVHTAKHDEKAQWSMIEDKIGEFHSHTEYRTRMGISPAKFRLGKKDTSDLKENPNTICILLAIKETDRLFPLSIEETEISGTAQVDNEKYLIKIGCYCYNNGKRKTKIKVPTRVLENIF